MARPKKSKTIQIVSLRLPKRTIEEIERYTKKLQADTPMFQVTTADAIRYLIALGLQEKSAKGRK
jgi:hypothetical protein